uniref:Uncharacterized protein n=1 Tax=Anguilla anguilla TaxID=7936 RepID=A0A0E9WCG3_ANGAN
MASASCRREPQDRQIFCQLIAWHQRPCLWGSWQLDSSLHRQSISQYQ